MNNETFVVFRSNSFLEGVDWDDAKHCWCSHPSQALQIETRQQAEHLAHQVGGYVICFGSHKTLSTLNRI